ncbi:MAG: cytochrome c [Pseudomonadota bacterium]
MRHLNRTLLTFFVCFLISMSSAQAFSFNFGDDDDFYPYWGRGYIPWFGPPLYGYYPRLPRYDRNTMVRKRQWRMVTHDETMDRLGELLYDKYGFDRGEAIKLARRIEMTSGLALTTNFHPGAVAAYRSRTTSSLWGNEQTFEAMAQALQAAAKELAKELEKQPTAEEGAVYLPRRRSRFDRDEVETVPVSAGIWEKFNALSNICASCHSRFRGPDW